VKYNVLKKLIILFYKPLSKYNEGNYILLQKARLMYIICFLILLNAIILFIHSFFILNYNSLLFTIPFFIVIISVLISLCLLFKGHFSAASNITLFFLFAGLWTMMFFKPEPEVIYNLDTISIILAGLTIVPVVTNKKRSIIPVYFFSNYIIFLIYVDFLAQKMNLNKEFILEYIIDNTTAIFFIFIVSFILHIIYNKALEKAESEIIHNNNLNQELEKKAMIEIKQTAKIAEQNTLLADKAAAITGVLHNIGNLLNNVSITSSIIRDSIKKTRMEGIQKLARLVAEHKNDPLAFLNSDKGRNMLQYITALAEVFQAEKNEQVQQLDKLSEYIDHMDEVIRLQQSLTSTHVIDEFTSVHSIIQEAIAMKEDALSQDNIEVIYNTSEIPQAYLDRHRILQILINLISNSRNALKDSQQENKILQINLKMSKKYICIEVRDNGPGIPPDNMQKIFKYGFSTRKDGHGFGLYYSANAALNMGGRLYAKANEDEVGVTFTLELPFKSN